jgi:hypothetical protein
MKERRIGLRYVLNTDSVKVQDHIGGLWKYTALAGELNSDMKPRANAAMQRLTSQ